MQGKQRWFALTKSMYGVLQEKPRIWIVRKCSEEIQVIRVQWGPTGEMLSDFNCQKIFT